MSNIKISLKTSGLDLDFEGSEQFFKTNLLPLLKAAENAPPLDKGAGKKSGLSGGMTTLTIAHKMKAKTGAALATAAACKLTFNDSKPTFTRNEILEEMKSAAGIYKGTFSNNLTKILGGLVKEDVLLESKKDHYSLSANAQAKHKTQLA